MATKGSAPMDSEADGVGTDRLQELADNVNAMFGGGYNRALETTSLLISALRAALLAYPTQRLGQLLVNALGVDEHGLFNIYDEDIARKLLEYAERADRA